MAATSVGVLIWADRLDELVEKDLHRDRRDLGQDQRKCVVRTRLDGAEKVGERIALVSAAGWRHQLDSKWSSRDEPAD
jgi:hypothetical protein